MLALRQSSANRPRIQEEAEDGQDEEGLRIDTPNQVPPYGPLPNPARILASGSCHRRCPVCLCTAMGSSSSAYAITTQHCISSVELPMNIGFIALSTQNVRLSVHGDEADASRDCVTVLSLPRLRRHRSLRPKVCAQGATLTLTLTLILT